MYRSSWEFVNYLVRVRRSGPDSIGAGVQEAMVTEYVRITPNIFWIPAYAGMTVGYLPIYSQAQSLSKDPLRDGLIAEFVFTDRLMGNDKPY